MKTLVAIIMCLMLLGCESNPNIVVPPEATVTLDRGSLLPCEPLEPLPPLSFKDINADLALILKSTASNAIIYASCKNKQADSIKLLKQFANIKEKTDVQKPVQTP